MATAQICYFLDRVPRELRDEIYKYVLTTDKDKTLQACRWRRSAANREQYKDWSILATCKQVYLEANSVFYRRNLFMLETCDLERLSKPPFEARGAPQLPSPLGQMRRVFLASENVRALDQLRVHGT
jgi:hypothetical protein